MPVFAQSRAEQFFDLYAAALTGGDLDTLAQCYSYPSIVVTDDDSLVIDTPKQVVAAFAGARATDAATAATATISALESPSVSLAWVTVQWSYSTPDGAPVSADAYRYLLRDAAGEVRICSVTPVPAHWSH